MGDDITIEKALYLNEKGMSVIYDADHNYCYLEGEEK